MKVLHVLNYGWPYIDGYTTRSIGLTNAQALHLEGVDIHIAVSPFTPLAHGTDINFKSDHWGPDRQLHATRYQGKKAVSIRPWERPAMGISTSTSTMFAEELSSIVRRLGVDIIHVHHPHYVAAMALQVASELGLPAVYELRCFNGYYDLGTINPYRTLRGLWQNHLEFQLAREASAVVTISDGLAATLEQNGVASDRLHVVRNSVDMSRFSPAKQPGEPETDSHGRRKVRVGYATTFETMENLDSAVRAAGIAHSLLLDEGIQLELVIAGTGRDWPRINAIVETEALGDCVVLPGMIPYSDMPEFYRSLDLFLVPRGDSLVATDTTPLKPLEALACGVPLLATGLPAMRELLANRSDVRFTDVDAATMASDLVAFARNPWLGGDDMSERSWATEVQRYHDVYACALRHGPPQPGRRRQLAKSGIGLSRNLDRGIRSVANNAKSLLQSRNSKVDNAVSNTSIHTVLCGFPRTGSTLLQLMAQSCLDDVRIFDGEVEALDVIAHFSRSGRLLTKCPDDILRVDQIADAYAAHESAHAEFVITVRDPRDILTSKHAAYTQARGYYVTIDRMLAQWKAVRNARQRQDTCIVRYETLVTNPDQVQALFLDKYQWPSLTDFAHYHEKAETCVQDSMTHGALGGVRPVDDEHLYRWRADTHALRIRELLNDMPELTDMCIDLGYETNDHWADSYRSCLERECQS